MQLEKYEVKIKSEKLEYEFYSVGPKGLIRKRIIFHSLGEMEERIYNLSFGDVNENTDELDDQVVSNNQDREKVLATVAGTILQFTNKNPDAILLIVGSTPSRTRLYQISIMKYWKEIDPLFHVVGFISESWEPFLNGHNYDGFLFRRKNT